MTLPRHLSLWLMDRTFPGALLLEKLLDKFIDWEV